MTENTRNGNAAETSLHLFQSPRYTNGDGRWSNEYLDVAIRCDSLTWDPAALLSYLSYGYVSCDRTLFQEVKRQPWLSKISDNGQVVNEPIPEHGFYEATPRTVASRLLERLKNEAENACKGFSNIYLLTSGGLDSRIVAGVIRQLLNEGRINAQIHSVTWGMDGSRDVEIGRAVAQKLDFPWKQLRLEADHLREGVELVGQQLGALVSPVHVHRMEWFRNLPSGGIVLGGSYGDSVGRAEFSGRTVLELLPYRSINSFGLLREECAKSGAKLLDSDWREYRSRFDNRPEYAIRECEHQAHYMRGLIAQTMSIINNSCQLYQMFTAPEVYSFIWSIHPAFRNDKPYGELLKMLGNELHLLPWARTNRPVVSGAGIKIKASLEQYHDYPKWIRSHLLPLAKEKCFGDWLESTQVFDPSALRRLTNDLSASEVPSYELKNKGNCLAWLLALKNMEQSTSPMKPSSPPNLVGDESAKIIPAERPTSSIRKKLREIPVALKVARSARKWKRRRESIKSFPPIKLPPTET